MNFRLLARGLPVADAVAEIEGQSELWRLFTARQEYAGTAHADTEMVPLRGPDTLEDIFDNLEAADYAILERIPATLQAVREVIAVIRAREVGRVMLTRLKAGGRILPHVDEGAYARYYARFHLVLVSNPRCSFRCGSEAVSMAPGELWWFNHQVEHCVDNPGPARTHLILDAAAPGFTGALPLG